MNMTQPAIRLAFENAHAIYRSARAAADALNNNDNRRGDDGKYIVDTADQACCRALDTLIEKTPSPGLSEVATKLRLAFERCSEVLFFPEYADAIIADLDRLATLDAMPIGASAAWEAYGHAVEAQVRGEADANLSPQQRADRALDAHRAWRCWCAAMDRELRVVAPIGLVSEEMAA